MELQVFVVAARTVASDSVVPVGFAYCTVIAYFFCLREIELSTMLKTSVYCNNVLLTVTIKLPATKTDPMALSCERTWGCICEDSPDPYACPYHAALSQESLLSNIFSVKDLEAPGFPFMPTTRGRLRARPKS